MYIGLFLFTIIVLLLGIKRANKAYLGLVLLQVAAFFFQFLVGRDCVYSTNATFLNLAFVNLNLFLIIRPWKKVRVYHVTEPNRRFIPLVEKFVYPLLWFNLIINIIIGGIVYVMIPDIAEFKLEMGFQGLYDEIPYFGTFFRIASETQSFGLIAIPLFFFHLARDDKKKAYKALLLSSSTLVSALAFYSRAMILAYFLSLVFYYFLVVDSLSGYWKAWTYKRIKVATVIIIGGFLIITIVRFASPKMAYYGDRIPANSVIKDPAIFSLFDYASQGYPNGIECLEFYKSENCLHGEYAFYNFYMALGYFGIINWNYDDYEDRMDKAFSGNVTGFKGYVASSVVDFGYILTLLFDLFFVLYIRNVFKNRNKVRVDGLIYSFFLLQMSINSIFYNYLPSLKYPFIVLIIIGFFSKLNSQGKVKL